MPSQDFSKSVFQADANAASDWGSIGAGAAVDLRAAANLDRGIDLDLGILAMANLDASFSKFLTADLQGSAQAQASVRAQIQLPMNLFDELGAAVRLQAIAELAAGVRLSVGLALGDFLSLAGDDPRMQGAAMRLLRVFLEEVDLQLGFYAKAALSAQAYANLVVTGSAIGNLATGTKPGFTIAAGAGAGLKAGAGFQVFGTADIRNFAQLIARSADIVVDDTVARLAHALPASARPARAVLFGARPALKIALRLSFELGEQFADQTLTQDATGQMNLSARGLQVVLEELQRAICEGVLRATAAGMQTLLAPVQAARQVWDGCRSERYALADKLESAPSPLSSVDATDYWIDLMGSGAALAVKVSASQPKFIDLVAMGWAALKLAARVGERVARASASVSVIGTPPQQVTAAFAGPLSGTVPPDIDTAIRATLTANGASPGSSLKYEDLVVYLGDKAILDQLIQANPGLATFLDDVRGTIAPDVRALIRLVLGNASSFALGTSSNADPTAALSAFAAGLQGFVSARMSSAFRAQLEPAFAGNDDLRVYVDEVLLPSLDFALAVTLQEIVGWATSSHSAKAVTEALSAVLLKLLGRSLVAIADTTAAHVQEQMQDLMLHAADVAARPNGLVAVLTANPGVQLVADDIGELISDALHVAADVFGPLPAERRARIRGLLYDVLDPSSGVPANQLVQQLENPGLIPNEAALRALAQELGQLATERFVLFVQGLVTRILQRMSEAWLAALQTAIAVAQQFLAGITQAIGQILQRLDQIGRDIQAFAEQIADAIAGALGDLDSLLDSFSSATGRSAFVSHLSSSISSRALGVLEDDWAYNNLVPGGIRKDIRDAVRGAVRELLREAPFDAFLASIGAIRDQVADIVDDARNLDRNAPLAPQIADLVIARLAALVADRSGTMHIKIAFSFAWNTPLGRVSQRFDLGNIAVHVGDLTDIVRPVAQSLGAFESLIDSLANRIQDVFDAEAATKDLQAEHDAASAEHDRLAAIAAEHRSGPKSVVIERPVQMQTTQADTLALIRLEGFSLSILVVDEFTPQRIFVLLNGEAVDLDSFQVAAALQLPFLAPEFVGAPPLATHHRGPIAAAVQQRSRDSARTALARAPDARFSQSSRATLGSRVQLTRGLGVPGSSASATGQSASVHISGHLPVALLVEGLNTLMVTVVTGQDQHVSDTVGFLVPTIPARRNPARDPRPKPGRDGIPKAVPLAPGRSIMVPSERKHAARTLARRMKLPAVHPLGRIALHSPVLAARAGIAVRAPLPTQGALRLTGKFKKVAP